MKIVICATHSWPIPTPVHTGDVVLLDLAIALTELGHDVSLVAPAGTKFPKLLATEACEGRGEPTAAQMEARALHSDPELFADCDIIHDFSVTKSFARAYPNKSIVTPLGGSEWTQLSTMRNVVCHSSEMRDRGLRGATDYEGTEWPLLAGPPQTPIRDARVVHLGVDTDWYCPGPHAGSDLLEGTEGRGPYFRTTDGEAFEAPPKEDWFLWLGRWAPSRGYKLAIELAKRTGIELVMSGERPADCRFEPERACAVEAATLARGASNIRFEWLPAEESEHQRVKRELYRKARAFLMLPAFGEPFGLQQIEALACGTPVVATPMGSIPEVLMQGVTGCIAREPTVECLAEALDGIGDVYPADCRAEAVQRFDRKVMADNYAELYAAVCAGETW